MNKKEIALLIEFLKEYSDRLSNDGCNDWYFPDDWSVLERQQFVKEFHEHNGELEYFDPEDINPFIQNGCAVDLLIHKLKSSLEIPKN